MKLVIAEKPSVAESIAGVLGVTDRKNGYIMGKDYIVSWCMGHLVSLASADTYDKKYSKWTYKDLPILPETWQYTIIPSTKKQFAILKMVNWDKRKSAFFVPFSQNSQCRQSDDAYPFFFDRKGKRNF